MHRGIMFACPDCASVFKRSDYLLRHRTREHPGSLLEEDPELPASSGDREAGSDAASESLHEREEERPGSVSDPESLPCKEADPEPCEDDSLASPKSSQLEVEEVEVKVEEDEEDISMAAGDEDLDPLDTTDWTGHGHGLDWKRTRTGHGGDKGGGDRGGV